MIWHLRLVTNRHFTHHGINEPYPIFVVSRFFCAGKAIDEEALLS